MDGGNYIALIVVAVVMLLVLYGQVRSRPEQFSWNNIERSFFTLGLLALVLIAFLSLVVIGTNVLGGA